MRISDFFRRWRSRPLDRHSQPVESGDEWRSVAQTWEALARSDPLWAVLSEPDKRGRKWDVGAFLATGEEFVETMLRRAVEGGARLDYGTAIDFGCGVGRLSRALSYRFSNVIGIDVSETMIKIARELNRDRPGLSFILNQRDDLHCLPDACADVVCSHITLQHMRPALAERYIGELFRAARPGGIVFLHVPSHLIAAEDAGMLAAGDCRAELLVRSAPERVAVSSACVLTVQVRNVGAADWKVPLRVGNHWRNPDGGVVAFDDGRAPIPKLKRGDSTEITLMITTPPRAGIYRLEVDIVQEGVRWFADEGSDTDSVSITVEPAPREEFGTNLPPALVTNIEPDYASAPPFEMHGVPRRRVEEIASASGMHLLRCEDHRAEWLSYGYYFEKQRQRPR